MFFNLVLKKKIMSLLGGQNMEVNEGYTPLAHTNYLVLLENTKEDINRTLVGLINASKRIELSPNQEKNKYMHLTRSMKSEKNTIYLKIDGLSFKQVNFFKYLRVNVNNTNSMHKEIKLHLKH